MADSAASTALPTSTKTLAEWVTQVATLIAAVGGVLFTVAVFAVTARDLTVGIPTAWTTYQAYVRVGLMLVPDSMLCVLAYLDGVSGGAVSRWPVAAILVLAFLV